MQYIFRLLLLLSGLVTLALGVSLSIHSGLGTSPISSVPYTFSHILPFSTGVLTIAMHVVMIALQMLILKKQFRWFQWMQLPAGIVFGFLIDAMLWLTADWTAHGYAMQMLFCLISCIITALGVCMVVKANLVLLAAEGLYQACAIRFSRDFGFCKTAGDISLVLIACISSWLVLHQLAGVREGTVITALLVGPLVKMILARLQFIRF